MKIDDIVALPFLTRSLFCRLILPLITALAVLCAMLMVFTVVPDERVMGAVQRIFYFHVGSAMAAYLAILVLFTASIFYLVNRRDGWDALAEAAASVAFLFSSLVLASGMIWGHSAWNVWWRWEPRLVSFLVLWLILFAYTSLRAFTEGEVRQRNFAAVLGILSAINVPIVIFSIKLLEHTQQLHPEVVAQQGLRDSRFVYALIVSNLAMLLTASWFIVLKTGNVLLKRRVAELVADLDRA